MFLGAFELEDAVEANSAGGPAGRGIGTGEEGEESNYREGQHGGDGEFHREELADRSQQAAGLAGKVGVEPPSIQRERSFSWSMFNMWLSELTTIGTPEIALSATSGRRLILHLGAISRG